MKTFAKRILQSLLGMENYLFFFSRWVICRLHRNKKEGDFLVFGGMLKNGDHILDIGANIGAMTVHLARKLPDSVVFAFEPLPLNIRILERIIRHYKLKKVEVLKVALGDEEKEVEMVLPTISKVKFHGLSHVVHDSITEFNTGERYRVPMKKLDSFAETFKETHIGGIKLDVENFEYFVLRGGENLIHTHRPLIYTELWENENRTLCLSWIKTLNYQVKVLEKGILEDYDPTFHKKQNFFFVPMK